MTVSEVLGQTWAAVLAESPQSDGFYRRRIPIPSPWPAHAGVHRPTDARTLVLETERRSLRGHRLRDETRGYSVDIGDDEAGRADRSSICIVEAPQGEGGIFTSFCADILEHWMPHAGASDAIGALELRLACWKKFFQREAGLDRESYIGLYGELSFVEAGLGGGVPPLMLVNAWQAMRGTNQDFLFGPDAVEIKAVTGNEIDKVRISNIRQLDATGLRNLFFCRYAFDLRQDSGRTLPQLVAELKTSISAVSTAANGVFCDRLLEVGLVEAVPNDLDAWGFTLRKADVYRVCDGFPRLLESMLPGGVSEVSYTVNLSAAASCRIDESDLWSSGFSPHV